MRHQGEMDADKKELLSLMQAALEQCLDSVFKVRFSSHFKRNEGLIKFLKFSSRKYSQKTVECSEQAYRSRKEKNYAITGNLLYSSHLPTEENKKI